MARYAFIVPTATSVGRLASRDLHIDPRQKKILGARYDNFLIVICRVVEPDKRSRVHNGRAGMMALFTVVPGQSGPEGITPGE